MKKEVNVHKERKALLTRTILEQRRVGSNLAWFSGLEFNSFTSEIALEICRMRQQKVFKLEIFMVDSPRPSARC